MNERTAIVLAAGKGTRMDDDRPKVLVECAGRPLIDYVLDRTDEIGFDRVIVVVGYKSDDVRAALSARKVTFAEQCQQLGTGHAVQMCAPQLQGHDGPVLILTGDSPLAQTSSITSLLEEYERGRPACILGTLEKDDPTGLGRIVRDEAGRFLGIVEEKDATDQQRTIKEVNMSTYVFDNRRLLEVLSRLSNNNQQGEYYITDCPGLLMEQGHEVRALPVLKPCEALSVNTREDLKLVEVELRRLKCGN